MSARGQAAGGVWAFGRILGLVLGVLGPRARSSCLGVRVMRRASSDRGSSLRAHGAVLLRVLRAASPLRVKSCSSFVRRAMLLGLRSRVIWPLVLFGFESLPLDQVVRVVLALLVLLAVLVSWVLFRGLASARSPFPSSGAVASLLMRLVVAVAPPASCSWSLAALLAPQCGRLLGAGPWAGCRMLGPSLQFGGFVFGSSSRLRGNPCRRLGIRGRAEGVSWMHGVGRSYASSLAVCVCHAAA